MLSCSDHSGGCGPEGPNKPVNSPETTPGNWVLRGEPLRSSPPCLLLSDVPQTPARIHRVPVWVRGHRNAHRNSCHIKQRPTTRQAHPETLCTRRWAWRFDSYCSCITDCLQVSCCSLYMTAWTLNQPEEDRLDFLFFNIAGKFNIFPVGE